MSTNPISSRRIRKHSSNVTAVVFSIGDLVRLICNFLVPEDALSLSQASQVLHVIVTQHHEYWESRTRKTVLLPLLPQEWTLGRANAWLYRRICFHGCFANVPARKAMFAKFNNKTACPEIRFLIELTKKFLCVVDKPDSTWFFKEARLKKCGKTIRLAFVTSIDADMRDFMGGVADVAIMTTSNFLNVNVTSHFLWPRINDEAQTRKYTRTGFKEKLFGPVNLQFHVLRMLDFVLRYELTKVSNR